MTKYTIKQLFDAGLISKRLKQVLNILGCMTFQDLLDLSKDNIKVDYLEKSYHLKCELYRAISDIQDMEEIIPDFAESFESFETTSTPPKISSNNKKFKVCDFTERLLKESDLPIKQDYLLKEIKKYLPNTYIESVRANLNGDPEKRFIFFLDGYIGLKGRIYDKRFLEFSIENKKVQYAEKRIMEFLSFIENKHRSPQPHGLEEEESLYRWYLDFTKSTAKELAGLRATFQEYLKEYDKWIFTPFEYTYKRNCDQIKWYVDKNLELPSSDEEPELSSWFNYQLENYAKNRDKRKMMFIELMEFLKDYGLHFCDARTVKEKKKEKINVRKKAKETVRIDLNKYIHLFESKKRKNNGNDYAVQKALLIIAIGNLVQSKKIRTNEITLNDDLLTEFADVCIDNVGTASSYNIAIPYYYLNDEPFWSLIPKDSVVAEDYKEEEITFDYIERRIACSVIDPDFFDFLSNADSFKVLKKSLMDRVINNSFVFEDTTVH